jgi:hypothetical protein
MADESNPRTTCEIITIYAPIFREKLRKLEGHGRENCDEAVCLRRALALVDATQAQSDISPSE